MNSKSGHHRWISVKNFCTKTISSSKTIRNDLHVFQ
ncbi:MAG: helix-turn-helix domain-containing protein [Nanoarchaeota archaeon]|nr:helix-turn-helix domain-containing protein [Nanoarchaeota archaeon]MBU1631745.1 helix-turn-helix domain-containing protein [Nanoarchaeota archaeon]MBU1875530.1 helix-turn-helix domain-containing protein [Nanoarchaeota archaeon]